MLRPRILLATGVFSILSIVAAVLSAEPAPTQERRDTLKKQFNAGNFKDAYEGFRAMALNKDDDPLKVGEDLTMGIDALQRLGRADEVDDFREQVIAIHKTNWRLLHAAADSYISFPYHYGFKVAGKFYRGNKRGGGEYVNATERDRVRAMQLMQDAIGQMKAADDGNVKGWFYFDLSQMVLNYRGNGESWRLQVLTDLKELPDYEQGGGYGGGTRGAPVDADGNPVLYSAPKRWEDAVNDGQRWRWALAESVEMSANRANAVRMELARFLESQFGVQTMAQFGIFGGESDGTKKDDANPFAVHTLAEDETIAQLANGVKRFKLPDEFNFIKIYQTVADNPQTGQGPQALEALAQIFENRRQYPRAADYWRRAIKEYGPGGQDSRKKRLEQIVDNWGRFEPLMTQPAGTGAGVDFTFRNGEKVSFEAHEIKVEKLLDDVKAYLKTRPRPLDWQKANIENLGYRLVEQNEQQYIGEKAAAWDLELKPKPDHFDRRITVETPLKKAGAYLLVAKMAGGNTSRIIIWVEDTAIVKKPLQGKALYVVADAVTGKPLPKVNIEFFGYRNRYVKDNQWEIDFLNFARLTDDDGQATVEQKELPQDYSWLAIARGEGGRLAYLGFGNVWYGNYYDSEYNATKVFPITDRPVYRPSQPVKFKLWVRHAKYDQENKSDFANQDFPVEIHNPRGEKVLAKQFKSDAFGGLEGEYALAADAQLGVYQILMVVPGMGPNPISVGNFRVEEYKKPEFEVSVDAPSEPIMLGEKIKTTIKAKYYFGSPVDKAKVHYKITRTSYADVWYPPAPWDWFYGKGYWWFGYDYTWYPGWSDWGCRRPMPWWIGRGNEPPEVVADAEVPIGADGTLSIEIDTAAAKAVHPDQDHQYQITAEVTDDSRRTIVGSGNMLVARKPFQVTAWVDRGYYRAGDVVHANFSAHTLAGKPVVGKGHLALLKISYDADGKPSEKAVEEWNLDTNDEGLAEQQLKAAAPGQYRLSYKLTDANKHTIEGAYVFAVMGAQADGASYRFNEIELIPDQREYKPGEKVKLMVNTNRAGGVVWLFVRPANGIYLAPKILRPEGKSEIVELDVTQKDMPNFFVEALTIADGRIFSDVKEIVVPPEQRVLNVAVQPSRDTYKPGQKATMSVKLTDTAGKPFVGSTVLAVYDKAVEYISGGSNVPEIKAFFWKWRRSHNQQSETNLGRYFYNLLRNGEISMSDLGVFGNLGLVSFESGKPGARFGRGEQFRHGADLRAGDGAFGGRGMRMEKAAAPMAANGAMIQDAAVADRKEDEFAAADKQAAPGQSPPPPELMQPTVRTKFADTALWVGALLTNESGEAEVSLDMPENLTTWKVKVWAMGHGTKVGQGEAEVVTRKDLIVRLQAPRFFVEKDEVVLSANVHNYLKTKKKVQVSLELVGKELSDLGDSVREIEVPAGEESRVDWRVKVVREGEATIRMSALTDEESDAVEQKFPVYVHGMLKMDSFSGAMRPKDETGHITIEVPEKRRQGRSELEVRYSPTLAGAMVDALPYLVDYPYGCTEQTLNRFLPTVITQKVLLRMGLDLKKIQDKRTNLNAQELGDDKQRAAGWKHYDRNPVFDNDEVRKMVQDGVQKLTQMQLADGGWGWFSGFGEQSWPHTTAVVVHGLQVAKQNDVALVPGMLERGTEWLKHYQEQQVDLLKNALVKPKPKEPFKTEADNLDAFVYMVLVDGGVDNAEMRDFLYRDRVHLTVYAKAMFGLALEKQGQKEKLAMILQNISQFVVQDNEDQTAYLKLPEDNWWWAWYGSEIEADAYYLKLLARTDPKGEVAPRFVKYLLNNRKHASYWNSTRDTSLAIEALAEYLKASGEDKPDLTVEVWLDGQKQKEVKITPQDLFTFDNKFVLHGDGVTTGKHDIELRKKGSGPLYYNAYLTLFSLEDYIPKAGLEVKVNRKIYKLIRDDKTIDVAGSRGQAVGQRVEKYRREELKDLDTLKSGDLVEVELEIDSKNDYEYLIFEDMKAAGFEPVEVRSGYGGNALGAYMELRDNRVSFFVRSLARGKHSVAYRLRAEIPGRFSALPARAAAMYAPELKGNSDEIKLQIAD